MANSSEIADFYSGLTVLVTGGTGFLGKVLIEKLLYDCKDVDKIYVLIRNKNGKSAQSRLKQLLDSPVFRRLKNERPNDLKKLVPCPGDIFEQGLGLAYEDCKTIKIEVSVVFHLAAVVNFDEKLENAFHWNVNGTNELVEICKDMQQLKAFVYVSTAFSNAERPHVEERVYPYMCTFEFVKEIIKTFPDDEYNCKKILGSKPNTYTLSKALAENVIEKASENIPSAIVRPSIVISTMRDPCPGFVDTWHGSAALIMSTALGLMKVVYGKGSNVTDLIPVDMVSNVIIAAATKCQRSKTVKVYNCCTGSSNPLSQDNLKRIIMNASRKFNLNSSLFNFVTITSNKCVYLLTNFIVQLIPSFLLDIWLRLRGKAPRFMKLQSKVNRITSTFSYFLLNQWKFSDDNVRNLHRSMSSTDKVTFNVNTRTINWESCIENYILGGRKYLLNSDQVSSN